MKYIILLWMGPCITSLFTPLSAQSISSYVIGSTGGIDEQLSYGVGELVVSTAYPEGLILTQGFQQPSRISISTSLLSYEEELTVSAFPNPTSGFLTLTIQSTSHLPISCEVLDLVGRSLVGTRSLMVIEEKSVQWDLRALAAGYYYLRMSPIGHTPVTIPFQLIP
ncbi:MAG: T9SS type A sorting domain-containing protein [Bacteroidota bacterium]